MTILSRITTLSFTGILIGYIVSIPVSDELGKLESEEVTNETRHKQAVSFTLRRWRDAVEMQGMLEKAFKDYGKGQAMSWLRTMSVLVLG